MSGNIIKDCICINSEHRGNSSELLKTAVISLNENHIALPEDLKNWVDQMRAIAAWDARREFNRGYNI